MIYSYQLILFYPFNLTITGEGYTVRMFLDQIVSFGFLFPSLQEKDIKDRYCISILHFI